MKHLSFIARFVAACTSSFFFFSSGVKAQVAPEGKYNTTNYPKDRLAIELVSKRMDSTQFLNDDFIAIGPEGKVSFGFEQWKKGFTDMGASFKSVTPVPGAYVLRVYNGDAAVRFAILDVVIAMPTEDLSLRVIRTEMYIKQKGKWYFVSGQGTLVMPDEQKKKITEGEAKSNQ